MILLPAKSLSRTLNQMDSLCRKLFTEHNMQEVIYRAQHAGSYLPSTTCRKLFTEHNMQEAIYQAQQSGQGARDHRQSRWKPNMMEVLAGSLNWRTHL